MENIYNIDIDIFIYLVSYFFTRTREKDMNLTLKDFHIKHFHIVIAALHRLDSLFFSCWALVQLLSLDTFGLSFPLFKPTVFPLATHHKQEV